MNKISCIIPSYNEGKRIARVLEVVANHPMVDEIIVVDDASTDNTNEIVKKYKNIKYITHHKNMGKSAAVYTGLKESSGEYIMFIDADLSGLSADDITRLAKPILENKADVCISLRKNPPILWRKIGLDFITGERIFSRNTLRPIEEDFPNLKKFGLEVFMNELIIKNKLRLAVIRWPNVESPTKYSKSGLLAGVMGEINMYKDILETVSFFEVINQIISMLRLKVRL